jgi:hypothetical protein
MGEPIGKAIGGCHHISFRDDVMPSKKLAFVHVVESYKEYNIIDKNKYDIKDLGNKKPKNLHCNCFIF